MMTSVVQESTTTTSLPTTATITTQTRSADNTIPPHVLIVGKKNALDYIAPALFRIGTFGELVVRAKGSMSIVTAVNVAEMVKKDVAELETRSVSIGTEEIVIEGMPKRVSYIEIHLAKPVPKAVVVEAPLPQDKLAETASTAKKIRAKAKKSTTTKKRATATVRKKKADA
jgi:DNA-binding protein Alba